ncbi:hypothetical protein RB595_005275 [Gaeumannomyces hyphopodioides]
MEPQGLARAKMEPQALGRWDKLILLLRRDGTPTHNASLGLLVGLVGLVAVILLGALMFLKHPGGGFRCCCRRRPPPCAEECRPPSPRASSPPSPRTSPPPVAEQPRAPAGVPPWRPNFSRRGRLLPAIDTEAAAAAARMGDEVASSTTAAIIASFKFPILKSDCLVRGDDADDAEGGGGRRLMRTPSHEIGIAL